MIGKDVYRILLSLNPALSLPIQILTSLLLTVHVDFQDLHGAERGETAALLLSPLKPAFKGPFGFDTTQNGSQFTFFLTAPLQAFYELVGLSFSDTDSVG